MQSSEVQYSTINYSKVQFITVPYSTVQYNALQLFIHTVKLLLSATVDKQTINPAGGQLGENKGLWVIKLLDCSKGPFYPTLILGPSPGN